MPGPPRNPNPADENIRAVAKLEEAANSGRSFAVRMSDVITKSAGSTPSLVFHLLWFAIWLLANTGVDGQPPFDPFPFSLLTSIVSLEAIFLTLFVLASQNRLTREADKRAHLDLQVNLLAEQEMTVVLKMLEELCVHFKLTGTIDSAGFRALIKQTDVVELAERVEANLALDRAKAENEQNPS
jgi:uncharacterized membrane protein